MSFRDLTPKEEADREAFADLEYELDEANKENDMLREALTDIAEGNVSKHNPDFLKNIAEDTRESFQERMNVWLQTFAKRKLEEANR